MRTLILAILLLLATGGAAPAGDTGRLALRCEPALPFFCRNIHILCAGRTKVRAPGIVIEIDGDRARVQFGDGTRWAATLARYDGASVLRPESGRDWVRLEADLRFSHRRYIRGTGAMSRGLCRARASG